MYELIRERSRVLKKCGKITGGKTCYWMSRDIRANDNWALFTALELSDGMGVDVIFCLDPNFPYLNSRNLSFLLSSLKETSKKLNELGLDFHFLVGDPPSKLSKFFSENRTEVLVTDFSPLRIKKDWLSEIIKQNSVSIIETDAHNVIPPWILSQKQEWSAYTIRSKIGRLLQRFLIKVPGVKSSNRKGVTYAEWEKVKIEGDEIPHTRIIPGERYANKQLEVFIRNRLTDYSKKRNDPSEDCQSGLSPYIHFGNISVIRIVLEIMALVDVRKEDKEAFLEELIVRRELAENFCFYNRQYDRMAGLPGWSKNSLVVHESDPRQYVYGKEVLEKGETHDSSWNACQKEMVKSGKMHGYMRMYWAKKILEWTKDPHTALEYALYLNDKYELDGRDPNGYAGILWAIGGLHDRPWKERPVFGKVRYMNEKGLRRKFDMDKYIRKIGRL